MTALKWIAACLIASFAFAVLIGKCIKFGMGDTSEKETNANN